MKIKKRYFKLKHLLVPVPKGQRTKGLYDEYPQIETIDGDGEPCLIIDMSILFETTTNNFAESEN